jgi:hypothetical protein
MSYQDLLDNGSRATRPVIRQTGPAMSKWEALDEFLWTYHDKRHTGAYAMCQECSSIWAFMRDNPKWNQA